VKILVIWFLILDEWLHASAFMRDLAAMADRNHRIKCILPVIEAVPTASHRNLNIDVVRLRRLLPIVSFLEFCLRAVVRLIAQYRDSDVLVVSPDVFPLVLPCVLCLRRHTQRPVLAIREPSPWVEVHGIRGYYHGFLRHLSLNLLSRFCDALFAISPMHANEIVVKFRVPPGNVHVWSSSVDTNLFDAYMYSTDRRKIRKELGIGDDGFLLIYHGVLGVERGLRELVGATHRIRRGRRDVFLLLLGKGRGERMLRELARSLGLDGIVFFHAPVAHSEVPRFIAAADAGVVPLPDQAQWRYQAPIKLLEYMAMGKPVIATDIAAHRWLAANRQTVFFCGRGSPTEIADAVLECICARSAIEEAGREEIAAGFSPSAVADAVLQVFSDLIRRRRSSCS